MYVSGLLDFNQKNAIVCVILCMLHVCFAFRCPRKQCHSAQSPLCALQVDKKNTFIYYSKSSCSPQLPNNIYRVRWRLATLLAHTECRLYGISFKVIIINLVKSPSWTRGGFHRYAHELWPCQCSCLCDCCCYRNKINSGKHFVSSLSVTEILPENNTYTRFFFILFLLPHFK